MQVIIGIIIWFIGVIIGIGFMCLFQVNRANEDLNYEVKIRKAIDKWKSIEEKQQKKFEHKIYEDEDKKKLDMNVIIVARLVAEELENIL